LGVLAANSTEVTNGQNSSSRCGLGVGTTINMKQHAAIVQLVQNLVLLQKPLLSLLATFASVERGMNNSENNYFADNEPAAKDNDDDDENNNNNNMAQSLNLCEKQCIDSLKEYLVEINHKIAMMERFVKRLNKISEAVKYIQFGSTFGGWTKLLPEFTSTTTTTTTTTTTSSRRKAKVAVDKDQLAIQQYEQDSCGRNSGIDNSNNIGTIRYPVIYCSERGFSIIELIRFWLLLPYRICMYFLSFVFLV